MAKKNYTFNWGNYYVIVPEIIDENSSQSIELENTLIKEGFEVDFIEYCLDGLVVYFDHHTAHIKRNEVEEIIYKIFK